MAFARTVTTTHTKTLISPDTGSADLVYGADYVSASSHTSTAAVSGADAGGVVFCPTAATETTSARFTFSDAAANPILSVNSLITNAYAEINAQNASGGSVTTMGIIGTGAGGIGAIPSGASYLYTNSPFGMWVGTRSATSLSFVTGTGILEQVRILNTASANRYVTLTGSNGANPTIGASGGQLVVQNGASFGPGLPTSLTIVGGIVTAAS